MHEYRLYEFTDEEVNLAKTYIAAALIGITRLKAWDYVDEMFNDLRCRSFTSFDKLNFTVNFEILGNDLLAAIGAAKEILENKNV